MRRVTRNPPIAVDVVAPVSQDPDAAAEAGVRVCHAAAASNAEVVWT